jgi:hypothetical protein
MLKRMQATNVTHVAVSQGALRVAEAGAPHHTAQPSPAHHARAKSSTHCAQAPAPGGTEAAGRASGPPAATRARCAGRAARRCARAAGGGGPPATPNPEPPPASPPRPAGLSQRPVTMLVPRQQGVPHPVPREQRAAAGSCHPPRLPRPAPCLGRPQKGGLPQRAPRQRHCSPPLPPPLRQPSGAGTRPPATPGPDARPKVTGRKAGVRSALLTVGRGMGHRTQGIGAAGPLCTRPWRSLTQTCQQTELRVHGKLHCSTGRKRLPSHLPINCGTANTV